MIGPEALEGIEQGRTICDPATVLRCCAALMPLADDPFRSPPWLVGGHLQTIVPVLARKLSRPSPLRRERWTTPKGDDFIDVDWQDRDPHAPLLVLFHGLEGGAASPYSLAFAAAAAHRGWGFAAPYFRGCSGEINLAPRSYHSGDHEEIGWILDRFRQRHAGEILAVGVSLGGNALLRWIEEAGEHAGRVLSSAAAISAPVDLMAGGTALGRGFINFNVYTRSFLRTLKPKALAKLAQYPGLFDRDRLLAARTLFEFDDVYTAPVHGFAGAADYWTRASAKPHLGAIRIPTLVLNARNDPFLPAVALPGADDASRWVTLWQPAHGGHVGFPGRWWPWGRDPVPDVIMDWLEAHRRT